MRITIGRFGLDVVQDNTHDLTHHGDEVSLSGRLWQPGRSAELEFLREQINGLVDNPFEPFYPATFEGVPMLDGYYRVTDASVTIGSGGLEAGYYPYTISMTKIGAFAVPLLEASSFGAARPNDYSVITDVPWHAVPATATGYAVKTTASKNTRNTADGDVMVVDAGHAAYFYNGTGTFTLPPENYYDGGAKIRAGASDPVAAAVLNYTGAAQTYVVPTGVTKITVDVRGAQGGGPAGGRGARIQCDMVVTAGETLNVYVGGRPGDRSGGFNGGGAGGLGSVAGVGDTGRGFGGGGGSDIRRGGTALSNRVVVAGGGGGAGGAAVYGFGGGIGGGVSAGTDGHDAGNATAGHHATRTAGGKSGSPKGASSVAGTAGTSGQGGHGADAPVSNRYGGGGGGGGLYGGGGAAGSSDGISTGGGGGGSGIGSGLNVSGKNGYRSSHGIVIISPVVDVPDIQRYTLIGAQAPNTPFGWELSNGILMITPTYVAGQASFQFQCWTDDGGWSPIREWYITDTGVGTVAAVANLTAFSVLENSPEECVIRANYEYGSNADQMTVTILLRRGSCLADVTVDSNASRTWGFRVSQSSASVNHSSAGNGQTSTGTDTDGNHWVLLSPSTSTRVNSGNSGAYLNAAATTFPVGVGFQPPGLVVADLRDQWYSAQTVTVRPVIR